MNPETPNENSLIVRRESGFAILPDGGSSVLSEIVHRSLVHIQKARDLTMPHRIGEEELCKPDYHLVCAWAKELHMTPENVLKRLLHSRGYNSNLVEGRFKDLFVDLGDLHISGLPSIAGLVIETLRIFDTCVDTEGTDYPLTDLDLSVVPNLRTLVIRGSHQKSMDHKPDFSVVPNLTSLDCSINGLTELDLATVPNLTRLRISYNQLKELDLACVPSLEALDCSNCSLSNLDLSGVTKLKYLDCSSYWCDENDNPSIFEYVLMNRLSVLDLFAVPCLTELVCSGNPLTKLDLSAVPNLTSLCCDCNQLTELDLFAIRNLTFLSCKKNKLTELDIRPLNNLQRLIYDRDSTILIQRPDQNF